MKNILHTFTLVSTLALSLVVNAADKESSTSSNAISKQVNTSVQTAPKVTKVENSHKLSSLININTASEKQLSSLKGIGSKKAKAIVEHREIHGSFASVEDLINVKGVGRKLALKLRDFIEF